MLISFSLKWAKPHFYKFFSNQKYVPSINLIKKLREETGSPINECKIALELKEGDIEKAKEHLKSKGLAQAQKRLNKAAHEGLIGVSLSADRQFSVIAEVNCETDFVARTDLFKNFIARLLETLVQNKISLDFSDVSNETKTQEGINHFLINSQLNSEKPLFPEDLASKHSNILEIQKLLISKLQENVKIRRILTFSQKNPGIIGAYVHNNVQIENIGTSACLVNVDADLTGKESCKVSVLEIADNMAMQILGTKPKYLYRKDIPETLLEEEKDRIKKEMEKTLKGKTPEIINNIVEGKLKKFYEDNILMDMEFILENDDGIKVGDYLLKAKKNFGVDLLVNQYHLWSLK